MGLTGGSARGLVFCVCVRADVTHPLWLTCVRARACRRRRRRRRRVQVARAVLRVCRLLPGHPRCAGWARRACDALLRMAARPFDNVLTTCVMECAGALELVGGRQSELAYAPSILRAVARFPTPAADAERAVALRTVLLVLWERALTQPLPPAAEVSPVHLLFSEDWLRSLLSATATQQQGDDSTEDGGGGASRGAAAAAAAARSLQRRRFRSEAVAAAVECMLQLSRPQGSSQRARSHGRAAPRGGGGAGALPAHDAWLGPGLELAQLLVECMYWDPAPAPARRRARNGGSGGGTEPAHGAGDDDDDGALARAADDGTGAAQLAYLRLVAKLCHYYQPQLIPSVIHDGVPSRPLQDLLGLMRDGLMGELTAGGSGGSTPYDITTAAEVRLRLLWLLAQHVSLREEAESSALMHGGGGGEILMSL
jgi:hypothetical protein